MVQIAGKHIVKLLIDEDNSGTHTRWTDLQVQKFHINDKAAIKRGVHRPDKVITVTQQSLMNCRKAIKDVRNIYFYRVREGKHTSFHILMFQSVKDLDVSAAPPQPPSCPP